MSQKILITGGAGYLGSSVTEQLLRDGHEVTVFDNLLFRQDSLLHLIHDRKFRFVSGDVRDQKQFKKLILENELIIPLAAIVGAPACDRAPLDAKQVNFDAISFLEKNRSKEQRVLYPTTNSGYGIKSGDTFCTEETPLTPISLYGQTKVDAENLILANGNSISLRLATVFGVSSRMRLDLLVNDFTHRAFHDGTIVIFEKDFKRNFIHVRDVARCFSFCVKNFDQMKNEAYNVGLNEANLSKEELAYKIKEHLPHFYIHFSDYSSDPDQRDYIISNDKIKKRGFEPQISLDEGIKELIKAFPMMKKSSYGNI